AIMPARFYPK
nr:Chain C, DNA polymerase PEPTIDE HOMOLOGUE [synthetic construct]